MFYPTHLNLQDRKCLVVGGGTVAERKVVSLLLSGGVVTLVSPESTELLEYLAHVGQIAWHKRQFQVDDTAGMFLVCAATDFSEINSSVFEDAYEKNDIRLVNVVDVIPECTFAAASVVACGNLVISISTSGKSPAMSRRIREHLESKFGAASFYTLGHEDGQVVPIENRQIPYPVYLLLKKRKCIVICASERMSPQMKHRGSLLQQCGASIEYTFPTTVNPHELSDAFLVLTESGCEDQSQLIEYLGAPQAGTFVTPQLVMDEDLIVSISTQSEKAVDQDEAQQMRTELANEFENGGYGAFIDFLGSLRPLVLETIPTQGERQKFFDTLIDRIPRSDSDLAIDKEQKCCLGFTDLGCSTQCVFNLVRHGQVEGARQYALERIKKKTCAA